MKIYILGICGTFMAGIAQIARELGCEVRGSDAQVYPPMSTQLEQAGIEFSNSEAHAAAYDAQKTAELFCGIVNRWQDLGGWTPPEPEDDDEEDS